MKRNNYIFYKVIVFIGLNLFKIIFLPKVYGKENIPKEGRLIIAGNHVSNYDAFMMHLGTNRPIHFLAKKELFSNKFTSFFFNLMHLIPVDRKKDNPDAIKSAIQILNEDKIIGIFPEGTYRKTDTLLPFKKGAVRFSIETNSSIIPFAIIGKFKLFSRPRIYFGKPLIFENSDIDSANEILKNEVLKLYNDNK